MKKIIIAILFTLVFISCVSSDEETIKDYIVISSSAQGTPDGLLKYRYNLGNDILYHVDSVGKYKIGSDIRK